ncbi:hypothetical protein [Porticoccus hydrocarbonoclasticus]|nr:hypothetical protein [Porticoccus hydrocarbonoclasticus]
MNNRTCRASYRAKEQADQFLPGSTVATRATNRAVLLHVSVQ